jgi:hypothetical protein
VAYEESLRAVSLDADSSLAVYTGVPGLPGSASPNSGKQFRFVKVVGAHQVGLCTAATNEQCIGVMQNKPQVVGQAVTVAIHGISMVQAGGTIAAGNIVKSDANGQAVAGTLGTDNPLGIAIGSAASGQLVPVLLKIS